MIDMRFRERLLYVGTIAQNNTYSRIRFYTFKRKLMGKTIFPVKQLCFLVVKGVAINDYGVFGCAKIHRVFQSTRKLLHKFVEQHERRVFTVLEHGTVMFI